jgi:hypothetical protein
MKKKLSIVVGAIMFLVYTGYGQEDSTRTRNDRPGTPQSLRTADQSPQSHVNIINNNPAPGQTTNPAATGNNGINNTIIADPNTIGKPVSTMPISNVNPASGRLDSAVSNSAIRNGVSNTTNPIRNK